MKDRIPISITSINWMHQKQWAITYPNVLAGPCLVLYSSSSRGMVRNFFIETPFSSSNLTKSMRSCSRACIMASSRAPCGHSWPYTNISVRAISTRFQVRARLSCSGGLRCWDLKSAVKMVWSSSWVSPSGFSWIRYTVIYSAITLTTYTIYIQI